jgi:alpha-L-arabinofuranosidase
MGSKMNSNKTVLFIDKEYQVGEVDPRLFGGFLEHIGRAVYEGVFDPTSKYADKDGFRIDVQSVLKKLGFTLMRYPGGNFASGYHWINGVGQPSSRPILQDLASNALEPNQFGTDEFMILARKMDWKPMLTVNLGTGSPEEACNWVEYCNSPTGTKYADLRKQNGFHEPYGVQLWGLGNEMDGPWQQGHVPAEQYALRARQAAKLMKDTDPSIELVVCGSSEIGMATYMEWDRTVLEVMGDFTDYISLHRYVGNPQGRTADYLAVTNSIDQQIDAMDGLCRYIQARLRSRKRIYLAFDEWNVWYRTQNAESVNGHGKMAQHLVEEEYNLEDALVVAGFLNCFLRHADVLKISNLAQIVNVIAPVLTRGDQLLLQSIYFPLLMIASRRKGISLIPVLHGPGYVSPSYGFVHMIDASSILDETQLHVFLLNRDLRSSMEVEIKPVGIELLSMQSSDCLTATSANSRNTFEKPSVVHVCNLDHIEVVDQKAYVLLPPLSFSAISFSITSKY